MVTLPGIPLLDVRKGDRIQGHEPFVVERVYTRVNTWNFIPERIVVMRDGETTKQVKYKKDDLVTVERAE